MQVDLEAVQKCLESDDENPHPQVEKLTENVRKEYPKWMLYLSQGFNVLLQGCGSKRKVLEEFTETQLAEPGYSHMVIRGYQMTVSVRQILTLLAENLNLDLKYSVNTVDLMNYLRQELQTKKFSDDVTLVIHSLDGPNLRDDISQNVLSILASIPNFHVIASVDHVNAFCLWDDVRLTRFGWIYIDATTFRTYSKEIVAGESHILGLSSKSAFRQHSVASLESVWAALSTNSRKIFVELARYVFETKNGKKALGGISFWQLYQLCRGEFLVSSEAGLSHVMVEFQDHHVVSKKKAPDGSDTFFLTVEPSILEEFLTTQGHEDIVSEQD